ncbi:hypothetical protein BN2476_960082 [Paraburkholderia piptadeniae]|uniref:Uncharacterized protein n=1 Tax=Paraburkholderia piptadeniae TaxID=1701573 RepID=A0A1N7STX4_9BURK|nr:hypothetical protein BN2476_960082 [Paraburkholderia piptadeniae]
MLVTVEGKQRLFAYSIRRFIAARAVELNLEDGDEARQCAKRHFLKTTSRMAETSK